VGSGGMGVLLDHDLGTEVEIIHPRPSAVVCSGSMPTPSDTNKRTASTTSEWEWRKIRRRPQGPSDTAPKASSSAVKSAWNPREPLTVTVRYRGGPEAWFELRARGRTIRRPGHVAMYDALNDLYKVLR
jgi:hypothetical protein